MGIGMILRCNCSLTTAAIILMVLARLNQTATVRGREIETFKYPPCTFNPLCTCSKPEPDLGVVQCRHVPFPAIPKTINNSKAFMLHMENTGLRSLESYFLQSTGLYRLEISHNQLTEIPDDAFYGLDRSLWELMLQHNELIDIPSRAIRHLQKLTHLDLSGNQISCIEPDSFRGLENSLHTLILAKNSINTLPPDSFSTLPQLETIDLNGNNLEWIDANIFRDGMPRLSKLLLSDNILKGIPYIATASLRQLRNLDISHNLIEEILPEETPDSRAVVKLTLDSLHLEFNLIENIHAGSFQRFDIINQTYLDGNPIMSLGDGAFRPTKIAELYIRHCSLQYISPLAFEGLGSSLQILDISANNITSLPDSLFDHFDIFRVLNLKDNRIKELNPADAFNGFQYTLLKLDMSGEQNPVISLQELRRMRNLRSLSLTKLSTRNLVPEDFLEFGLELEDLKVTRGSLQTIKSHAFMHVRGLKRLDLSENQLSQIEPDAFNEIGHSLLSLKISHGLTGSSLPADAIRHLTSLQELDLSNNQLKTMSDTSFHFLKNLRHLELQDNQIEQVLKGTFQVDIHSKLQTISLSFNHLRQILQHTFVDLEALQQLELGDNRIEHLERRAFMNLDQLRHLNLRGNKLNTIAGEAFQIFKGDQLPQHLCNGCESVVVNYYDRITTYEKLEKKWLSETSGQNTIKSVLDAVEAESQKIRQTITALLPDYPTHQRHNILAAVIKTSISPSTDNFNVNGRSYLNTVLDYELPPISTDEDQSKIDEDSLDASRFEMSRRVKKKKKRNPLRDYIRRGKRRKFTATAQTDRTANVTPVTDASIEKATCIESTANTQISNDPQCSHTTPPPPLRKRPGPKPKSKLLPSADETGGSLDKEFVHWKKPGPQATPVINENRLRRSRRQFEHESSKEDLGDATVLKVKRSASNTRKIPQSVTDNTTDCSVEVPNESVKEMENEERPTDTEIVSDDKATSSGVKAKIVILKPREVLKGSVVSNEVVRSDSMTTKSNDSQSEDSDRPSSKNRKRIDESDIPGNESKKKRQTSRINYSEALVDEALMYEEMLLNEQAKEQLFIASTIESSKLKPKTVDLGKNNFSMDYDDSNMIAKKTKLDVSLESLGEICVSRKEKMLPRECSSTTESAQKMETAGPDVRLSEISITPISKPKSAAVKSDHQINVSLKDIKKTFKSNPESVFNISSAVSIQLKSAACIKSDHSQLSKGLSTTCQYCRKQFTDIKQLAVHQVIHLKIETHKIGSPLVLSPSFRRGRMVPMGNNKCFRCLNCWRLYPNSQSILQHWVTGKCIFYCSICGQSFHQNPKLIRDHFPEVHGIKFKMPNSSSAPPMAPLAADSMSLATQASQRMVRTKFKEQIVKGAPAVSSSTPSSAPPSRSFSVIKMKPPIGRVKCHICSCSFPNMQSRNSHMRLHKHENLIKPMNLRQLISQPQRPIQMNFNNAQHRPFPNANRIQPNHAIGAPNRPFRTAQPTSQQRAIKPADSQRPSQFSNQSSQHRTSYSKPTTFTVTDNSGSTKIKTESSNFDSRYRSSDFQSNSDFPEFSELFQNETTTEPTAPVTNFVKSEMQPDSGSGGVPRLQVKKLHELQEPNYVNAQPISVNTFYTPTTIQPLVNTIPQYQLAAPLQLQVPQLQPIQPQFQIASVQHVQNTQYYNPVLVVSQPSQHTQEGYQYVPEQVDYSKYYS